MDFFDIDWADSNLEKIEIEYDKATLVIWNDSLQQRLLIKCTGLAGLTNLCIWDDTHIMSADIKCVSNADNNFLSGLYAAYDETFDYGGRSLRNGLLALNIELSNHSCFSVYCIEINVDVAE